MLQEISKYSILISRNEDVYLTWHNSILTVHTDKDIVLYEISGNLQCLDKKIDVQTYSVPVSKCSPLMGLIPQRLLEKGVKNIDYTEMILDPSLWPHNPSLVEEMTIIADIQWSPVGFLYGNECALAVLNNIGNIDILGRGRHVWNTILSLSETIKEICLTSGEVTTPKTLDQLKDVAYAVETSAICWAPIPENNSCLFATAQKNSDILLWSFFHQNHTVQALFLRKIPTGFGEIISMVWIPKTEEDFGIVCSNTFGQMFLLHCKLKDLQAELVATTPLWSQKDKMVTKYICYNIIDNRIVLMCNKHRHLLILVVDKTGQVISQLVKNVNDYRITDIKSNYYGNFLTTVNCKFYKIILKIDEMNHIDFEVESIDMNDMYSAYECYGLAFSTNNVIWALSAKQRKIVHRQRKQKSLDIVFVTPKDPEESESKELMLLLTNQTEKLTNYWDCIELLRYKTMKSYKMPAIDYEELWTKADKNIYKLKLYFIFLNLFLSLEKLFRNPSRKMLPELSLDAVKEKILALHAKDLIMEINCNVNNEVMLEKTQYDKYYGAKQYLLYYCKKYNRDIRDFIEDSEWISDQKNMPKPIDRICQSCDEEVQGFTCNNGHFNIFCSLTFTPIDGFDYLVCRNCGATARSELCSTNPVCVFCDMYLSNLTLPT